MVCLFGAAFYDPEPLLWQTGMLYLYYSIYQLTVSIPADLRNVRIHIQKTQESLLE